MTSRTLLLNKCSSRKEAGLIADDDFFLRVGEFTDVVGISQPLSSFRVHRDSATGQLASISQRLAEDYLFQTRYYHSHESILDKADIQLIEGQAIRFINAYLLESMISVDSHGQEEALRLRQGFEALVSDRFSHESPAGLRLLWAFANGGWSGPIAAKFISQCLRMLLRLKHSMKHESS